MDEELIYAAAFVAMVSGSIAIAIIAVKREGRNIDLLIKQLIIWIGIVTLLPLTSRAGATLIHPSVHLKELSTELSRVDRDANNEKDDATRDKLRAQQKELDKQIENENRLFYRAMFWISFPIGMIAMIVGFALRSVPVGTGLASGGLTTLAAGCYSYWNDMGDALRFSSLLLVLVILTGIGLYMFGRTTTLGPTRTAL